MTQPTTGSVPVALPTIPLPDIPGVPNFGDAAAYLAAARAWMGDRHNWIRVAWTVVGVALVYGGVVVIANKPLREGATKVASVAGKVV